MVFILTHSDTNMQTLMCKKHEITCTHMLYAKTQDTILVVVTVNLHMWDDLSPGGELVTVEIFIYFLLSFFNFCIPTLPRSSIGIIITMKIFRDKIETSSSLHYLPLQLLEITISKCDFHHLLLIKLREPNIYKAAGAKIAVRTQNKAIISQRNRKKKLNED